MTELEFQTDRLRLAIERAERAEAKVDQARADFVAIRDHAPMGTHAYLTANAAIGRLK